MDHAALSFPEALKYIAEKYKIHIEEDDKTPERTEEEKRRESIVAALKFAQVHFSDNLTKDKVAGNYLVKRQLTDGVKDFSIGYASNGNALLLAAQAAGYSTKILLQAGLVKENPSNGRLYDAFSNRIIFTFYDRTGRIIGFSGRLLVKKEGVPKYLNSAETEVFKKSRVLFGLYQSKKFIIQKDDCLLVEGQTDMISLYLGGIRNVVAASGTALSEEQVKMIRTFSSKLTLIYDYDPAGVKAAVKNVIIPLQAGLEVHIVVLPPNEDPDSYIRKVGSEAMQTYIDDNRKDIVSFRIDLVKEEIENNPFQKAHLVKEITGQFSVIPDEQIRNILIDEISRKLDVKSSEINNQVKKLLPKPKEAKEKKFFGLDESIEAIKEKDQVIILSGFDQVVERHSDGCENAISLPDGYLFPSELTRLSELTKNIIIEDISLITDDSGLELPLPKLGRQLTEMGCHVVVFKIENEKEVTTDFVDYYIKVLSALVLYHPNTVLSKQYVELAARFLSQLDNTIINIKTAEIAKQFGIPPGDFRKVLKPFIDARKSLAIQSKEHVIIDDQQYIFDITHLPDYVDREFYDRYAFFPAENKSGHKIFYVFRTPEHTLQKIGNFYIEPLFHVYDPDFLRNKRVARFYHAELNIEQYVEFKSSDSVELAQFKKFLWNTGGYVFSGGKQWHYEKILESQALKYPICWEITTFGVQLQGFFAFSNGIIADGHFTSTDEMGLVRYKDKSYYSPSSSIIHKDHDSDNDPYEYDRYLTYREDQRTSWVQWAKLMFEVYKYNNNGMWALLFTILAANRSIIFPIDRLFTALFFIGPTDSGKSRIAESIRAPWMFGAPLFNLNSGTDAAFFTAMERFRDIPMILEEYNDPTISEPKFQGLKAAVLDNEGKQKRRDATSKTIDVSKVNVAPLILGQNGPERDDAALGNRVIQLHVPKKDDWTDQEVSMYKDLKDRERDGLSNIALEIYKRRPVIQKYFAEYMRKFQKLMKHDIHQVGGVYQTRIIGTVSLFVACAKLWEDHVPELPLPFKFDEFYKVAKKQVIQQSSDISSSNKLAVFFDTIGQLYTKDQIKEGREFSIETVTELMLQVSKVDVEPRNWGGQSRKVLFLIVSDVCMVYQKVHGADSLQLNALRMYLKDHPAYIGQIKSHRFNYQFEEWENDPFTKNPVRVIKTGSRNTSCVALDYKMIELMGVDLERIKTGVQTELEIITKPEQTNGKDAGAVEQTGLDLKDITYSDPEEIDLPF